MEVFLNIRPNNLFSERVSRMSTLTSTEEPSSSPKTKQQEISWRREDSIVSQTVPLSENVASRLSADNVTDEDLINILKEKVQRGDDRYACFQLGQLYMERKEFSDAREIFEYSFNKYGDLQSLYQLAVIHHDGLDTPIDSVKAFEFMEIIVEKSIQEEEWRHLFHEAAYHIGSAYYVGDGVKGNVALAEKWWLIAAQDGSRRGCLGAQLALAFHFCHKDYRDLNKAFFWFSEACGNGSLEAQGALGIMYFYGLGVQKNYDAAFECLREAAERGNIYAQGHLVYYYYVRKLFTKATELGTKLVDVDNVWELALATSCSPVCIRKGLAVACFIMARCLDKGKGVQQNSSEANALYHKSCQWDMDVSAVLQQKVNLREI